MKPFEKITYDKNTGEGVYSVYWKDTEVNVNFTSLPQYKTRPDKVREKINQARKRAYAMYFAEENRDAFYNFINYVAIWFEPSDIMMQTESVRRGREVVKQDIINEACKYYASNTRARGLELPRFALDINEVCNGFGLKDDEDD